MNAAAPKSLSASTFESQYAELQKTIYDDISQYASQIRSSVANAYGPHAELEAGAFFDILERDSKRLRGVLTITGFQLLHGKNTAACVIAARAIEMIHAYLLIVDDIQDKSELRRGGPSAHVALANYHKMNSLKLDASHFGVSVALNAAVGGMHAANMLLANLDADEETRLKIVSIVNRSLLVTTYGQTADIVGAAEQDSEIDHIEQILDQKTAVYTVLNPLHVGMVLAGADCHDTDAIADYAHNLGKAFQILNDLKCFTQDYKKTGKTPLDDVREGKITVPVAHTLRTANQKQRNVLSRCLGNPDVTLNDFDEIVQILNSTGSIQFASNQAKQYIELASSSLRANTRPNWDKKTVAFLESLGTRLLSK